MKRGDAYRVEAIDASKAAITLKLEDGRDVDWRLRQWGAGHSQAFVPQPLDLKTGDRIRFTRNDREASRINGERCEVVAVDGPARVRTRGADADREELDDAYRGRKVKIASADKASMRPRIDRGASFMAGPHR